MLSSPQQRDRTNISLRSPDTIKPHHAQKIEVIYNSLREHKLEFKEPPEYIDIYTPDILLRILDAKAGQQVNREVFLELFSRVNKDMRSQFNIYDWINVYIEAEEILVSRMERCKLRISELNAQENQLQSWLEAEYNNMRDTRKYEKSLWINVLDGEMMEDQRKKQFPNPVFVVIRYGDSVFESNISEDRFKPTWNQAFKIVLNDYDKFFTIAVRDSRGLEHGSIKLNVVHFEDQKKRKEWIYLSDNASGMSVVKLQLSIVLLRANLDRIQNDINDVDVKINEAAQDLIEYERMINELYAPFHSLNFGEFRLSVLNVSSRPSVFSPQGKVGKTEKRLAEKLTSATQRYISNWAKFFYVLSFIVLLFSFLANLIRVSFVEIVMIFFVYIGSVTDTITQGQFRLTLAFGFIGILQDVAWLFYNTKNWCNDPYPNVNDEGCQLTNIFVLIAYIGLGFKVLWWLSLWRNSVAFQEYHEKVQFLISKRRSVMAQAYATAT